jgi:hypothetical protein
MFHAIVYVSCVLLLGDLVIGTDGQRWHLTGGVVGSSVMTVSLPMGMHPAQMGMSTSRWPDSGDEASRSIYKWVNGFVKIEKNAV